MRPVQLQRAHVQGVRERPLPENDLLLPGRERLLELEREDLLRLPVQVGLVRLVLLLLGVDVRGTG